MKHTLALLTVLLLALTSAVVADELERNFVAPPDTAKLSSYWWWLNGNVTREAITRDLEALKEKGFGGALITDAGGANQDGNRQVPHGPDFASPQWRELYRHALREAARLKLEMALNIQSGWNLGGPGIVPEDAAKILCWTETVVQGPGPVTVKLPAPTKHRLLREVAVLAVPERTGQKSGCEVTASSSHRDYPARFASDGDAKTFWVSDGSTLPDGALAWIRLAFDQDRPVNRLVLSGRPGYGPKTFEVFAIGPDGTRRKLAAGRAGEDGAWSTDVEPVQTVRQLEIRVTDGHDPAPVAGRPRNIQVAEIRVEGPGWRWPSSPANRIPRWVEKALYRPVAGANHDTSFLVPSKPASGDGPAVASTDVVDLSRFTDVDGRLQWTAPAGTWRIHRFGYTVGPGARVSTCSEGWDGLALDPMDAGAFQRYWDAVVEPLMTDAKDVGDGALKYLHTDSWEIEPFNWTASLPAEFQGRCGYDMRPWLPVLAGRVLGGTEASERFLHDFRKTVAALIAENYYGPFLKNAHRHGLQVRAESGGPHGVPIDAQHCLGMIDVPMSEFWARSWRHRVPESARFFVKQPASAAHTYGKEIVAAEGFTTIGPHWQETVWDNLKPTFDKALCEGLNQLVWTLVTCSPREMGLPGQEMFPGTHFNPNSTWWRQSEGFLTYINRCQWMLRQGPVRRRCALLLRRPCAELRRAESGQPCASAGGTRLRCGHRARHPHAPCGQQRPVRFARRHELRRTGIARASRDLAAGVAQTGSVRACRRRDHRPAAGEQFRPAGVAGGRRSRGERTDPAALAENDSAHGRHRLAERNRFESRLLRDGRRQSRLHPSPQWRDRHLFHRELIRKAISRRGRFPHRRQIAGMVGPRHRPDASAAAMARDDRRTNRSAAGTPGVRQRLRRFPKGPHCAVAATGKFPGAGAVAGHRRPVASQLRFGLVLSRQRNARERCVRETGGLDNPARTGDPLF
jgi:hypothetical protein